MSNRSFGSIRKLASGRYQPRFTEIDGSRGKPPGTFATKREADEWLTLKQADRLNNGWVPASLGAVTLSDFCTRWLVGRHDLRPGTRSLYESQARRFITGPYPEHAVTQQNPVIGDYALNDISPALVREWMDWVRATSTAGARQRSAVSPGSPRANRAMRSWARENGLRVADTGRLPVAVPAAWEAAGRPGMVVRAVGDAGATQSAQVYRLLHTILEAAVDEGRLRRNPCRIKKASQSTARTRVPATPEDVERLVRAMPERYAAAVEVAAWGGLRAGEVFGLARRHVDVERGTVRIERTVNAAAGTTVFGPPKTEAGKRTVHLPRSAMESLAAHMEAYTLPGQESLVFPTTNGTVLRSSNRSAFFRRAAEAAGRPDLTFHDLRHTGATRASEEGASIAQLQHRMGHSTPQAVLRYQHAVAEADAELARRMDERRGTRPSRSISAAWPKQEVAPPGNPGEPLRSEHAT